MKLWVDKYRPKTMDDYVWRDTVMRDRFQEWVDQRATPHLLLSGAPGSGKTSVALLLMRELQIPSADILMINASKERRVENIEEKVCSFGQTWAFGETGLKYIILDECDSMSPLAQKMLRNEIETYSDVTRFILTANYPQKIIPAIHSRMQHFSFDALDYDSFTMRAGEVLVSENVEFDQEVLFDIVKLCYPDLRKCINTLQKNSSGNPLTLHPVNKEEDNSKDYMFEVAKLFEKGKFLAGRKMILEQATVEEYPDLFKFLYRNLDIFGDTDEQKDDALLVIRDAVVNHAVACDPEINLSAALVELSRIK